ncbi:hypothetical protein [Candidatus Poriferisocius sp.]|uniref:hypothetical protein n=1 Tax=Candidatus Poriferisocius sp. TaxID=3101276 RepID=UPI003B01930A
MTEQYPPGGKLAGMAKKIHGGADQLGLRLSGLAGLAATWSYRELLGGVSVGFYTEEGDE